MGRSCWAASRTICQTSSDADGSFSWPAALLITRLLPADRLAEFRMENINYNSWQNDVCNSPLIRQIVKSCFLRKRRCEEESGKLVLTTFERRISDSGRAVWTARGGGIGLWLSGSTDAHLPWRCLHVRVSERRDGRHAHGSQVGRRKEKIEMNWTSI